jgi:hypothetical protein
MTKLGYFPRVPGAARIVPGVLTRPDQIENCMYPGGCGEASLPDMPYCALHHERALARASGFDGSTTRGDHDERQTEL